MKRTLPALLSLSLTLWATAAVSAPGDKRIALVIGNAAYESFGRLANPGNDADDIASVLRRVGFEVVDGRDLSRVIHDDPGPTVAQALEAVAVKVAAE